MRKNSLLKVLHLFLNITLIITILAFISSFLTVIMNPEFVHMKTSLNLVATIIIGLLVLFIFISLKRLVKTVENDHPFCQQNVLRLRNIGYSIFLLGLFDIILKYPTHANGFEILATSYGSIKISVFVYIILGLLALLLSEIFNQAFQLTKQLKGFK